jgi:hypothetical protein
VKTKLILASAALVAAAALLAAQSVAAQDGPPPSAGTRIAEGLMGSLGATIGPDGALYVAEGGTGGDIELDPPPDAEPGAPPPTFGLTAQVTRIDPATGAKTVAGSGLPSVAFEPGQGTGPVDVAFIGNTMYVLTTGSADALGQPDWPNGIYRVDGDDVDLIADISEFNNENNPGFPDGIPGGNPFSLDVRGNEFFVTDGNFNRMLRVAQNGTISLLAQFENVVPTGLEAGSGGAVLMTQFGPFPHTTANSFVVSIGVPSGSATNVAGGIPQLIDVENGPGGTYVLSFGEPSEDPEGPPAAPFSGAIYTLNGSSLDLKASGYFVPTSLDFSGDTAFITTLFGEVWRIDNFSAVQPPAPEPTTAPPPAATPTRATGVTAPDTGTGPTGGSNNGMVIVALAIGALGLAIGGAALRMKRA